MQYKGEEDDALFGPAKGSKKKEKERAVSFATTYAKPAAPVPKPAAPVPKPAKPAVPVPKPAPVSAPMPLPKEKSKPKSKPLPVRIYDGATRGYKELESPRDIDSDAARLFAIMSEPDESEAPLGGYRPAKTKFVKHASHIASAPEEKTFHESKIEARIKEFAKVSVAGAKEVFEYLRALGFSTELILDEVTSTEYKKFFYWQDTSYNQMVYIKKSGKFYIINSGHVYESDGFTRFTESKLNWGTVMANVTE